MSDLQRIIKKARRAGFQVEGASSYTTVAARCGLTTQSKVEAREFLFAKFSVRVTSRFVAPAAPGTFTTLDANSEAFLQSYEWRALRFKVLQKYGRKCQCCGATPATGAVMHVDHIRSRRKFPQLALDIDNLQVLCNECNHGKGNQTADFRQCG